MNDKELLELAAKAAGYDVVRSRLDDPMNHDFLVNKSHRNEHQASGPWNPLTDDGDAQRLAVKLELNVLNGVAQDGEGRIIVDQSEDPYAATRRAITRAAAEIGRAMK
jgi:hypothetical protein